MSEVPLYNLISSVRKSISAGGGREGRFIQGDEPVDHSRVAGLNILQPQNLFFFFFALVTGPRMSLRLMLSDTRV